MNRVILPAFISLALFAFLGACVPGAPPDDPPRLLGAGSSSGGWVAIGYPARALRRTAPPDASWRLYHLGARAPVGSAYNVMSLESRPVALAARGSALYLVFDPLPTGGAGALRSVRSVTAVPSDAPVPYLYEPPGRLAIEPSLPGPGDGDLAGFGAGAAGPVALIRSPSAEPSGRPPGPPVQLLELAGGGWRAIVPPAGFDAHSDWRLVTLAGDFALAEFSPVGERPRLWTPTRSPEDLVEAWSERPTALSPADSLFAPAAAGIVSAARTAGGVVVLRLLRAEESTPLAEVAGVTAHFALAPGADTINVVWLTAEESPRIHVAAVSTLSGEVLHAGPSAPTLPIGRDDIRFLALVLAIVALTVLVFVLRPEVARKSITLPEGAALAPPERRLLAALIDLAIPLGAVSAWSGAGPVAILLAPLTAETPGEFWPFALTLGAMLGIGVIGESWLGRTPGKALAGLRVVAVTGARLSLWQAFSRNLIKVVCPPITLVAFADPSRRHPGDVLAGAVVITRASAPPPERG